MYSTVTLCVLTFWTALLYNLSNKFCNKEEGNISVNAQNLTVTESKLLWLTVLWQFFWHPSHTSLHQTMNIASSSTMKQCWNSCFTCITTWVSQTWTRSAHHDLVFLFLYYFLYFIQWVVPTLGWVTYKNQTVKITQRLFSMFGLTMGLS